jgi:hypothetical protein
MVLLMREERTVQVQQLSVQSAFTYQYWGHFTHNVPHEDSKEVRGVETMGGRYLCIEVSQGRPKWKKLIDPTIVNAALSQRNKRHLQQMLYEKG